MRRCLCWLAFCMLLVSWRAEAIEREQLCWRGLCAGMTGPKIEARLKTLGFIISRRPNWLTRLLDAVAPGDLPPNPFFSATGTCLSVPCNVVIYVVRFPSGQYRLNGISTGWLLPAEPLLSTVILDLQKMVDLGPPEKTFFMQYGPKAPRQWVGWWPTHYLNDNMHFTVDLVEKVPVKAGALSPPELATSVHANKVQFELRARTVYDAYIKAWQRR